MYKFYIALLLLVCSTASISMAQVSMDLAGDNAGSIKVGHDSSTCNSANEGFIRYNSNSGSGGAIQVCHDDAWTDWGG